MQALLSLAEFMEQHEQSILIDQSKLSALAERCKAHAKVCRYHSDNKLACLCCRNVLCLNVELSDVLERFTGPALCVTVLNVLKEQFTSGLVALFTNDT